MRDMKRGATAKKRENNFNYVQRCRQHFLEVFPIFSTFLFVGGLSYPGIATAGALVFMLDRNVFIHGYSIGIPVKRSSGAFGYIGLVTLFGTAAMSIYKLYTSSWFFSIITRFIYSHRCS